MRAGAVQDMTPLVTPYDLERGGVLATADRPRQGAQAHAVPVGGYAAGDGAHPRTRKATA